MSKTINLLEVQASVRREGSVSRQLSAEFIEAWRENNPRSNVVLRDVGTAPPAHPDALWTLANYTDPSHRTAAMIKHLAESDELINDFTTAERIILAVPMYNFTVPSGFKSYIDNIVRVGKTFDFDAATFTFRGLAGGKKVLMISPSAADYAPESEMGAMDFCEPYVKTIMNYVGITDFICVKVPNQFRADMRENEIEAARRKLLQIAGEW